MDMTVLQVAIWKVLNGPTAQTYSALSDADAAAALNTPIYTPRTTLVTWATLAGSDALGPAATAMVMANLRAAAAQTANAALAAMAALSEAMLSGAGFNAADPAVPAEVAALVSAGILTNDQATAALNVASYAAGSDGVQATDVTSARAYIALRAAMDGITKQWSAVYQAGLAAIQAASDAASVPTLAALRAITPITPV